MTDQKEEFKQAFIQRLIRFSLDVMRLTDQLPREPKYQIIINQLIRAATSIGANVVEAKAASSRRDYLKFFEIALKSSHETKYWLLLLHELKQQIIQVDNLSREAVEITKILTSSVLTLKGRK